MEISVVNSNTPVLATDIEIKVVETSIGDNKSSVIEIVGVGPQGPRGASAEDVTNFLYQQLTPSVIWNINHNLGFKPLVECFTSGGLNIEGSVLHLSLNQLTINFNSATSGTARLLYGPSGIGKQTIFIPASAMISRATNGAGAGTLETATNCINVLTLDFDTVIQEFSQFQVAMPKSWNEGTVTFDALWFHPATTTNFGVVWSLTSTSLSDSNALDTAFGTAVQVTDTGGITNTLYITAESSAVTIGNTPAENDYAIFQVARVPADANDTMAVDARLLGVRLFFTTNAGNDN